MGRYGVLKEGKWRGDLSGEKVISFPFADHFKIKVVVCRKKISKYISSSPEPQFTTASLCLSLRCWESQRALFIM